MLESSSKPFREKPTNEIEDNSSADDLTMAYSQVIMSPCFFFFFFTLAASKNQEATHDAG